MKIIFYFLAVFFIMLGVAWAMTPTPWCFFPYANAGACSNVTLTNPLPTVSN